MTRSSLTLAVAFAALAFDAPPAAACAGPQPIPAISSPVAAMVAVVDPGAPLALQRALVER